MPPCVGTKTLCLLNFEKVWRETSSIPVLSPGKLLFGDVYVTDINYVRKQDDLGKRLTVASNLKFFIGFRIFHKKEVYHQKIQRRM